MDPQQMPPDKLLTVSGDEIGITIDSVFLTADTITDEQMTSLGSALVCGFERHCEPLLMAIWEESIDAVRDPDKLRALARRAKSLQGRLSEWTERLGDLTTEKLRILERGLGAAADTILKAINSPPPEESDLADWWKHLPGEPDGSEQ